MVVSVEEERKEVRVESAGELGKSRLKERGEEDDNEEEEGNLPQPPIHSSRSSRDNLGDEDPRIIRDVGIVYSSSNAKAQARVPLHTGYD